MFPHSWPDLAFRLIAENGTLLCCDETLSELTKVFVRPRFDAFCARETRVGMLYDTIKLMKRIEVAEYVAVCRDPKDDIFLSLALAGNARVILSGDKDLLVLDPFRGIRILSPRDYLNEN